MQKKLQRGLQHEIDKRILLRRHRVCFLESGIIFVYCYLSVKYMQLELLVCSVYHIFIQDQATLV